MKVIHVQAPRAFLCAVVKCKQNMYVFLSKQLLLIIYRFSNKVTNFLKLIRFQCHADFYQFVFSTEYDREYRDLVDDELIGNRLMCHFPANFEYFICMLYQY